MAKGTCTVDGCDRPQFCRSMCRPCYRKVHEYPKHRDAIIARATKWNAENVERRRKIASASARRSYHADIETHRAAGRASEARRRAANPERARAAERASYQRNRQKRIATVRRWMAANPERYRAIQHNREMRKRNAPGRGVTGDQWSAILAAHDHACFYCEARDVTLAIEHVNPLARGGWHDISNIVPACKSCNSRKGTLTAIEFIRRLEWQASTSRSKV